MTYAKTKLDGFNNTINLKVAKAFFRQPKNLQLVLIDIIRLRISANGLTEHYNEVLRCFSFYDIIPFDFLHIVDFIESKLLYKSASEIKELKRKIFENKKAPSVTDQSNERANTVFMKTNEV